MCQVIQFSSPTFRHIPRANEPHLLDETAHNFVFVVQVLMISTQCIPFETIALCTSYPLPFDAECMVYGRYTHKYCTFHSSAHRVHTPHRFNARALDVTLELIAINMVSQIDTNLNRLLKIIFRQHALHFNLSHQLCLLLRACVESATHAKKSVFSFRWFGDSVMSNSLSCWFFTLPICRNRFCLSVFSIYFEIWERFKRFMNVDGAPTATMCRCATWFLLKTSKQNISNRFDLVFVYFHFSLVLSLSLRCRFSLLFSTNWCLQLLCVCVFCFCLLRARARTRRIRKNTKHTHEFTSHSPIANY